MLEIFEQGKLLGCCRILDVGVSHRRLYRANLLSVELCCCWCGMNLMVEISEIDIDTDSWLRLNLKCLLNLFSNIVPFSDRFWLKNRVCPGERNCRLESWYFFDMPKLIGPMLYLLPVLVHNFYYKWSRSIR